MTTAGGPAAGPRWFVGCDRCDAGAWVGRRAGGGADAWCEACQRGVSLGPGGALVCPICGAALALDTLRAEELYGEVQHALAVARAWGGDPEPLATLLPDRPAFLTDLDPPEPEAGDGRDLRAALAALHAGAFADAQARLERLPESGGDARRPRALAVARERLGDAAGAEAAWTHVLERGEDARAQLARGALRARRGDVAGAGEDFARAGDGFEARWNRAALIVQAAVARAAGPPGREPLARARAALGEASPYWSSPTVGRLLWALLAERLAAPVAVTGGEATTLPSAASLRDAEGELEFDTFWDRALLVRVYAGAGPSPALARVARPLADGLLAALAAEPALRARGAESIAAAIAAARVAVTANDPHGAAAALAPLLARADLARYRVPCARCGAGTVGMDRVEDSESE